jgi:hypothetical protein
VVMNWAVIALLLRISDQTRRPAPTVAPIDTDDETQVVKLGAPPAPRGGGGA